MVNILTTAKPVGVATRDIVVIVGAVLTVLGALGLLTEEQVKTLTETAPVLFTAFGTVMTVAMSAYRIWTKSSSDKAAEVAKQVDEKVPAADPVLIKTPKGEPDIVVSAKGE